MRICPFVLDTLILFVYLEEETRNGVNQPLTNHPTGQVIV